MITTLLRLYLTLTSHLRDAPTLEYQDDLAHRMCETALYAAIAPGLADEETTPLGEFLAEGLCRNDAPPQIVNQRCVCVCHSGTEELRSDCVGDGTDETPWDCAGDEDACDDAMSVE